jgi:hypothetical protein
MVLLAATTVIVALSHYNWQRSSVFQSVKGLFWHSGGKYAAATFIQLNALLAML